MIRYIVEKQIGDDEQWYREGSWTDPTSLALAMWELGLTRPEYSAVRVREELIQGDSRVSFLMRNHNVTYAVAQIALRHNEYSVIHAGVALSNDILRYQYMREAGETTLG